MDCTEAEAALLQSLEESLPVARLAGLRVHVAGCLQCQRFEIAHRDLDHRLEAMVCPPEMSRSFRTDLFRRIRSDAKPVWTATPDIVHFVTCGVATALCAVLLPFHASMTLGVGAVATSAVYFLMTIVRDALELADDRA